MSQPPIIRSDHGTHPVGDDAPVSEGPESPPHHWSPSFTVPQLGPVLKTIRPLGPAEGRRSITLHRALEGAYPGYWIVFDAARGDEEPRVRALQISDSLARTWGEVLEARCHTTDPSHPWNEGRKRSGYHRCGTCGRYAWIEVHGMADGSCECCGMRG